MSQSSDPGIPLNCPKCGAAMTYVRTDGDTHIYHRGRDGAFILPPDGRVRPQGH